ncbi:MAG: Ig-like domain-containing protein [Proteobacteria bacterium]|nr:Ig-like domain-containing protein [Pseudomonadota bacterium]
MKHAQQPTTRTAFSTMLAVLLIISACGGGGGSSSGGGGSSSGGGGTIPPQPVQYQMWECTIYRQTDGLTGLKFWGSCPGSNWTLRANQPVFGNLEACEAAIQVEKDTDPVVYDNSEEDRNRGWARKLLCAEPDTTAPAVSSVSPEDGSSGFPIDGTTLRVEFSDNMDTETITTTSFTLVDAAGTPVSGTVTYFSEPRTAHFSIDEPLTYLATYTARLSTDITDKAGNPLGAEYLWTFTAESNPDVFPPAITSRFPDTNSVCGRKDGIVTARFDDHIVATPGTFTLEDSGGAPVDGTATFGFSTATFASSLPLNDGEVYTAHLGGAVADTTGNTIMPATWSFRTELAPEGNWTPIATPASVAGRGGHTAIWTGNEMIIWGGHDWIGPSFPYTRLATDNGRFDPALDQWRNVSTINAPSPREQHTATWTGTEMIIWGGALDHCTTSGCFSSTNTGGRYDPVTDTWAAMSAVGAPSPRRYHTAIWTGTELIVYAGMDIDFRTPLGDGARYDPVTDTWSPLSDINAPAPRSKHHAIFDGQRMIVWGGNSNGTSTAVDGAIYDPTTDTWSVLPSQNAPEGFGAIEPSSVVSTGSSMLVWLPEGKYDYDPVADEVFESYDSQTRRYSFQDQAWSTVINACNPRATPNAVWLNGRLLSWGSDFSEGQLYDEQLDTWVPISPYPGMPAQDATVVVIGDSVIVWGGDRSYNNFANTGYRLSF